MSMCDILRPWPAHPAHWAFTVPPHWRLFALILPHTWQADLASADSEIRRLTLALEDQERTARDWARLAARKEKELRSEEEHRIGLEAQVLDLKVKG
jgi:hypothetical protein